MRSTSLATIVGVGTATPEHTVDQDDAARLAVSLTAATGRHGSAVGTLYRRSGVRRRHVAFLQSSTNGTPAKQSFFQPRTSPADSGPGTARRMCEYEHKAAALAIEASAAALEDADVDARRITHLVTVSCTGFAAPGFDIALIDALSMRPTVERTHVGFMGCHGALNGLRVARALCGADPHAVVLLCAAELCSLHFQYGVNPQAIVSNSLFGDGAAAVVITSSSMDRSAGYRLLSSGSTIVPDTHDFMSWRIGDNGFEMTLSPRVPEVVTRCLGPWLDRWLADQSLRRQDVGAWAIHPGGPRILQACGDALELSAEALEASRTVLRTRGNMSSPTVLFILEELRKQGGASPTVMLAFGPGLTIEAALLS